jgi:V-type H+-transporting ATPase subunit F
MMTCRKETSSRREFGWKHEKLWTNSRWWLCMPPRNKTLCFAGNTLRIQVNIFTSHFFKFLELILQEVGKLIAVIGDEDTVTGFLLAGVGHRTAESSNFLIVKQDTKLQQVEEAFKTFSTRSDIGIILINQHIANDIRHVLKDYHETIPTVLEIPSKEHPYDPEQDYIMQRVNMFLGGTF